MTSLFVTHDQEEAFEVADRVVVMNRARIEQVGTPDEAYHRPASSFVYDFLGHVNHLRGDLRGASSGWETSPIPCPPTPPSTGSAPSPTSARTK